MPWLLEGGEAAADTDLSKLVAHVPQLPLGVDL